MLHFKSNQTRQIYGMHHCAYRHFVWPFKKSWHIKSNTLELTGFLLSTPSSDILRQHLSRSNSRRGWGFHGGPIYNTGLIPKRSTGMYACKFRQMCGMCLTEVSFHDKSSTFWIQFKQLSSHIFIVHLYSVMPHVCLRIIQSLDRCGVV